MWHIFAGRLINYSWFFARSIWLGGERKARKNWENQYFQSELHMKAFFTEKSYKNIFMASFIVCSSLNTPNYVYCVKLRRENRYFSHLTLAEWMILKGICLLSAFSPCHGVENPVWSIRCGFNLHTFKRAPSSWDWSHLIKMSSNLY